MKKLILVFLFLSNIFISFSQNDAQKSFSEGVKLLKANKYSEAELKFDFAISNGKTKNGIKMSYIYKGFCQKSKREYQKAISSFNEAIKIDSLDPASYADRGIVYLYQLKYDSGIMDYEKVLTIDSTGKQAQGAYYYLGRTMSLQYKNKEAIFFFDKLIALAPKDAEAYYLRGLAKSNSMDVKGSISDYDMAIKYNSKYMEAYANRGVQKINALPVKEKLGKTDCLKSPCADLLKAKELGDKTVNDMIFLYCKKCK